MKNPLFKRLPREFLKDIAKYIVMFFFLMIPLAVCSGYMIGNDSMIKTFNKAIDKYNLEDGHFQTSEIITDSVISEIELENDITIYDLSYKDESRSNNHVIRLYKMSDRENINKWCIHSGKLPVNDNEIALDRLYCENNHIKLGNKVTINNIEYILTCKVSLFDYSTLFKNNTDSMFDANKFSISLVTDDAFNLYNDDNLVNNYAFLNSERLSKKKANQKNEITMSNIYTKLLENDIKLNEFLTKEDNQAIQYSITDIKDDLVMMMIFGFILVFGLSFVFALSTKSQIESEAKSIGTLKAMGYRNTELLVHYLILPTLLTLIAGVIGNIFAYTFLKQYLVKLYYHSYSLPIYETFYNPKALIYTTILPIILVFVINLLVILKILLLPSLNLLKNQLARKKNKKVIRLSKKIKFIPRFQLRVILQNKGTYIALFFGTLIATTLLMFGLLMTPLLKHYKNEVIDSQIAPYQTILKEDIDGLDGEKSYVKTLDYKIDEITVFGLDKYNGESKYLNDLKIKDKNKVIISSGVSIKYRLKKGSKIKLKDQFLDKEYKFTVEGIYNTTGTMAIFMDMDLFTNSFSDGYLASYFSDNELDISQDKIYKTISQEDLLVISNQMADSMGEVFKIFTVVSIVLFILLIFLLAKIVIEKNQRNISMLKIIGYRTKDINNIFNVSTGIVTIISLLLSTLIGKYILNLFWNTVMMTRMKGWLDFYVATYLYPVILLIGILSFLVVYLIESFKISKINLSYALKEDNL